MSIWLVAFDVELVAGQVRRVISTFDCFCFRLHWDDSKNELLIFLRQLTCVPQAMSKILLPKPENGLLSLPEAAKKNYQEFADGKLPEG